MLCSRLVLGASIFVFSACSSTSATPEKGSSSTAPDGGSSSSTQDESSTSTTAPLTCLEVFSCAAECTGTGCEDACLATGSSDARSAVNSVLKCYETNGCADAPCLQTKCGSELGACATQATPTGGTAVTTVPAGSAVPTQLARNWTSFYEPNQATRNWTFNADGTARYYNTGVYDMPGGCKWGTITDSNGTVVVAGDELTYYQTAGTEQTSQCGVQKTETAPVKSYVYRWSIESNGQLLVNDLNIQACIDNPGWRSCRTLLDPK
jgi:hypothetical protein